MLGRTILWGEGILRKFSSGESFQRVFSGNIFEGKVFR
jgi:hypothetical protein